MEKQKNRPEQNNNNNSGANNNSSEVTRREFVQYSTFALVAAVFSGSFSGCGGGGGGAAGVANENAQEQPVFNQTSVGPGHVLEIKSLDSPGVNNIPEDIFSITVSVDDAVSYDLRPIYFKEGWIGIVIIPMVHAEDGSYFDSKEVEISLFVRGAPVEQFTVTMNQDLSVTNCGGSLLPLLDEISTELSSIEAEKENLFQDAILSEKWDRMYPMAKSLLDSLFTTISSVCEGVASEVTAIGGDIYNVTAQDIAMTEQLLAHLAANEPEDMGNGFLDLIPEPGGTATRQLTAILSHALSGASLAMTREWAGVVSGTGSIAAILTAVVPTICMCIAGNCLRLLAESETLTERIMNGINWYANILKNQGHGELNDHMICNFGENSSEIVELVTQDSIGLLEDVIDSQGTDNPWNNSAPWSNTPWHNNLWSNNLWNNAPIWNDSAWNDFPTWTNNPWINNVWNNTTPWSDNAWNNFVNSGASE